MAKLNCPVDGPATSFTADPLVTSLYTKVDDYYGLVLVAGWPPSQSMAAPYQEFLEQVRTCFDKTDLVGKTPNVYLYPVECLHVTIATLYHVQKKDLSQSEQYYNRLKQKYVDLVNAASERDGWPRDKSSLQLQLESVQLGQKAGILLWNDFSGSIAAMRNCIKAEAAHRGMDIKIPNIIHSTFLRFAKEPSGCGIEIQQRFQTNVAPRSRNIFQMALTRDGSAWDGSLCKLICETTPYMHVPNDNGHVYLKF